MNNGIKVIFISALTIVLAATFWICIAKPQMHKPFSVNTIEYLLKINKDGSVTTTTQITETVIKKEGEVNEK